MDAARHIYESLGFQVLKEIDQQLGKRYWLYKIDLTEIPEEAVWQRRLPNH